VLRCVAIGHKSAAFYTQAAHLSNASACLAAAGAVLLVLLVLLLVLVLLWCC
jgi:hypothetical protein